MKRIKGEGNGKIILFGEHFVVHGAPAIAAAIDNSAIVEVEPAEENAIITKQTVISEMSLRAIAAIEKAMGIREKFRVHLSGNLPTYGGLGSSAAFCIALVRSLAAYKNIRLNKEQLNAFAFEGEKEFHSNPSGIDNYVATYGGVILFKKGRDALTKQIEVKKRFTFVVGFTGKMSPTAKMVEEVGKLKQDDEEKFGQLLAEATEITYKGVTALEKGKTEEIGILMNENHHLLRQIGVSDEKNDEVVELMLSAGALGAKLTGGGGGGCCIALARDRVAAMEIERTLKKNGFDCFITLVPNKTK